MTIEQKQRMLAFLTDGQGVPYYSGQIDGKWGPKSKEAAERFMRDFSGEDVAKEPAKNPGDFWDDIQFFTREEFRCKCGGKYCNGFPAEPDEQTVRYADEIRRRLGTPLKVNSGLRCKVWNQKSKGANASKHMTGLACDLGTPKGITPEKMATVAEEVVGNTGGIGIYSWGIHIDSRPAKTRWNG